VVAIAAAAAVVAAAAIALGGRSPEAGSGPSARLAAAAPAILVLGAIAVFVGADTTEPRRSYFAVAWHEFNAHPLLGSGAGTFGHYWLQSTHYIQYGGALDAHSLYLETLAELGPVGLVLLLAFLLYPLRFAVAYRAVPGVPVATGAAVAFLIHAGVDWDWELPAVVVAGLCCLAALPAADNRVDEGAPRLARLAALACAVILGLAAIAGTASNAEPSAARMLEAP
jgi:O-antigen ligase